MSANKHLFLVFFLLSVLGALSSCKKAPPEEQMVQKIGPDSLKLSEDAIKNLTLSKVVRGDFPEKLSLMGKISVPEDRTVVIPSRLTGRIEQIFVASGEVVKTGEPLCTIFSADFAVAREEYIQTLQQIKATPTDEEAKHLLELSKKKLNALGVSEQDYSKWGTPGETGHENLVVRAPRSGALLGKNAVIGNLVNVGDTLFMLGDLNKVWFAGDIYPEDLPKVHKDQEVVIDQGSGNPACHGKVSFISPAMDPNSRTIKIRVLMDNPGSQLRADMYVQGNIILSRRVAIIAPKSGLIRLQDTNFVFKRFPDNVFKKVMVSTDGESADSVAVSQGLNDGDEVVSEGGLLLDAALAGAGT
jgi:multidrug efflux pump subunit AcrA (membrane-fusion protein)